MDLVAANAMADPGAVHNDTLMALMANLEVPEAYIAVCRCAESGRIALPLQTTWDFIRLQPELCFEELFTSTRWSELPSVVSDMTASKPSPIQLRHLRVLLLCNEHLPRPGLTAYVARAMAQGVPDHAVRDVINLARMCTCCRLDLDHVLCLAMRQPRLGIRLLRDYSALDHRPLVANIGRVMDVARCLPLNPYARALVRELSWWAPERTAAAISSRQGICYRMTSVVTVGCLWCMTDYLRSSPSPGPVQRLLADDLPRAVRAGLFTDGCVRGPAMWPPPPMPPVPVVDRHTLVYYMARTGCIPHEHMRLFAAIDKNVMRSMVRECAIDGLATAVRRACAWVRRGPFMVLITKDDGPVQHWSPVFGYRPLLTLVLTYI